MTTSVHANLTGSDLHEPKGAATALSGEVYVSDGAGSGVWTPASNVITNSAFTTGDLKMTHKAAADAGWILWVDGTIGDGSSSATVRANADTAALFTIYWTAGNTLCPVSGGHGVSAAADFAAHKTITLPVGSGRVLGIAGTGSGLTIRGTYTSLGEESHTLAANEIAPHTHPIIDPGHLHTGNLLNNIGGITSNLLASLSGSGISVLTTTTGSGVTFTTPGAVTGVTVDVNTGGQAHNNMQPTSFVNMMIKL